MGALGGTPISLQRSAEPKPRKGPSHATPTTDHETRRPDPGIARSQRDRAQNPVNTTRTCNKLQSVNWFTGEVMALDRGTLAKIDRRVFAELGHTRATQTVKVPLSDAMWSTWRRYCEAIGLTMGEGIAGLVDQELGALVSKDEPHGAIFAAELERRLAARSEALEIRERRLDEREQSLRESERLLRARTRPVELPSRPSVGRNDPCPCGSGYKYKRCHGN